MRLTRQHFQLIAEVVNDYGQRHLSEHLQRQLAKDFADRLAATNSTFNRGRFIGVATGELKR